MSNYMKQLQHPLPLLRPADSLSPSRLSAFKMADEGDVQTAERIKAAATVDFLFSDGNFLFTSRRIGAEVNLQSSDFILRRK